MDRHFELPVDEAVNSHQLQIIPEIEGERAKLVEDEWKHLFPLHMLKEEGWE